MGYRHVAVQYGHVRKPCGADRGRAVSLAADEVRKKTLDVASTLLEASADDLTIESSQVFVVGSPGRAVALADVAATGYYSADVDVDHLESPSPVTVQGIKGMGEWGLIGTLAAVINAALDALAPFGPPSRTPLTLERVLRAIGRLGG